MQLCSSIANHKCKKRVLWKWNDERRIMEWIHQGAKIVTFYPYIFQLLPATCQSYFEMKHYKKDWDCVSGEDKMGMPGSWVAECCCRYRSLNLPRLKERPSVKCLISTIFFFFFPEAKLLHFDNNGSITSTKCQISRDQSELSFILQVGIISFHLDTWNMFEIFLILSSNYKYQKEIFNSWILI